MGVLMYYCVVNFCPQFQVSDKNCCRMYLNHYMKTEHWQYSIFLTLSPCTSLLSDQREVLWETAFDRWCLSMYIMKLRENTMTALTIALMLDQHSRKALYKDRCCFVSFFPLCVFKWTHMKNSYNWNQVQNASRPNVVENSGERNLNKSKICIHPSTRASKVGATWTSVRSVSGLLIRAWFWFALTTWAGRNEFCYHQADHQFVQLQLSIYLLSKRSSP